MMYTFKATLSVRILASPSVQRGGWSRYISKAPSNRLSATLCSALGLHHFTHPMFFSREQHSI